MTWRSNQFYNQLLNNRDALWALHYLQDLGWTRAYAEGILGSAMQESQLNINAVQGNYGANFVPGIDITSLDLRPGGATRHGAGDGIINPPTGLPGSDSGIGIFQHTNTRYGDRAQGLQDYLIDNGNSLKSQLDYVTQDLQDNYPAIYNAGNTNSGQANLNATTDQAAHDFYVQFEAGSEAAAARDGTGPIRQDWAQAFHDVADTPQYSAATMPSYAEFNRQLQGAAGADITGPGAAPDVGPPGGPIPHYNENYNSPEPPPYGGGEMPPPAYTPISDTGTPGQGGIPGVDYPGRTPPGTSITLPELSAGGSAGGYHDISGNFSDPGLDGGKGYSPGSTHLDYGGQDIVVGPNVPAYQAPLGTDPNVGASYGDGGAAGYDTKGGGDNLPAAATSPPAAVDNTYESPAIGAFLPGQQQYGAHLPSDLGGPPDEGGYSSISNYQNWGVNQPAGLNQSGPATSPPDSTPTQPSGGGPTPQQAAPGGQAGGGGGGGGGGAGGALGGLGKGLGGKAGGDQDGGGGDGGGGGGIPIQITNAPEVGKKAAEEIKGAGEKIKGAGEAVQKGLDTTAQAINQASQQLQKSTQEFNKATGQVTASFEQNIPDWMVRVLLGVAAFIVLWAAFRMTMSERQPAPA